MTECQKVGKRQKIRSNQTVIASEDLWVEPIGPQRMCLTAKDASGCFSRRFLGSPSSGSHVPRAPVSSQFMLVAMSSQKEMTKVMPRFTALPNCFMPPLLLKYGSSLYLSTSLSQKSCVIELPEPKPRSGNSIFLP